MRRILAAAVVLATLVAAPAARAWTWPHDGPILRSFSLGADVYAGGQHRGVDIGAAVGTTVLAPASGTVSFVGSVPNGGRAVTIQTSDGYAVTLLQLGSVEVARGDAVEEGATVGAVGESADATTTQSHVHLGIRRADDPDGYVDPLGLLPDRGATSVPAPVPVVPEPAAPDAVTAPEPPSPAETSVPEPVLAPEPVAASTPIEAPEAQAPVAAPTSGSPVAQQPAKATVAEPLPGGETRRLDGERLDRASRPNVAPRASIGSRQAAVPSTSTRLRRAGVSVARAAVRPVESAGTASRQSESPRIAVSAPQGTVPVTGERREAVDRPAPTAPAEAAGWDRRSLALLLAIGFVAGAAAWIARRRAGEPEVAARIMVVHDGAAEAEDPRRSGMAVRERSAPYRARCGIRRPVRHLRPLSPTSRQRRSDGEWHRRERYADHGRRRSGRSYAA